MCILIDTVLIRQFISIESNPQIPLLSLRSNMVATSCKFVEIKSRHESTATNKVGLASENFKYMS